MSNLFQIRDFQEINYPKKRTTEAQSTQRENFCISFGTFFYLEVSKVLNCSSLIRPAAYKVSVISEIVKTACA